MFVCILFCEQKTAYEMRISDWSSDVCSSDLLRAIVSMRNRRNNMQLVEIAEIERTIQRIDKFRMLVIQGFQAPAEEQHGSDNAPFLCRDAKNNMICISLDDLGQEVSRLENCRERLVAL